MEKKTIGTFLAALRKASGMTQKQLAEKLNVSDKAISRWERDECAPDLTLIPVLAEIYGVTADEILRGQRRDPEAPERDIDKTKVTKQRHRLLSATWLRFKVQSIIAIAISIIGLIVASVCNFDLYQAHIGFMAGSVFFLTAAVCQIIFLILDHAAIADPEWTDEAVNDKIRSMVFVTEVVLSFVILLLAACIPLAGIHRAMLPFASWLDQCPVYLIIALAGCIVVVMCVNRKLGYKASPKNRLRFRCGTAVGIALVLLMLLHMGLQTVIPQNRHLFVSSTKHETRIDFLTYIETPLDPDGAPMEYRYTITESVDEHGSKENRLYAFYQSETTGRFHKIDVTQQETLDPGDGRTPITGYHTTNLTVAHVEVSNTQQLAPIYTFTADEYARSQELLELFDRLYPLLYLVALMIAITVYSIKVKKFDR